MSKHKKSNYLAAITAFIIVLLFISTILTACSTDDPELNVKLSVTDLSDQEFNSLGTTELDNPAKDDFKNIKFLLHIKQSNRITNRSVIPTDFQKVSNSYDKARYWFGSSSKQDNPQENFADYQNNFVLYTKGLDDQGIKNIFKSAKVKVSWTAKNDVPKEKVINLVDIIQFK